MLKIAASEMQREFSRYRDMAIAEPLVVVEEGREAVVVLSEAEFARLTIQRGPTAYHVWELPTTIKDAIDRALPPDSSRQFNRELDG